MRDTLIQAGLLNLELSSGTVGSKGLKLVKERIHSLEVFVKK